MFGKTIERQALDQAILACVVIDHRNRVVLFNAAAEALWGYPARDVLGRNVAMLLPEAMRARHDAWVERHRRGGEDRIVGSSREVELQHRSGELIPVRLSLSRIRHHGRHYYGAFLQDVSAERAARDNLMQVLEQAIDAVVSIDTDNRITFFNAAAETLWGYRRDEVLGENVRMLVPEVHRADHDAYIHHNRRTGEDRIVGTSREVAFTRKDGEPRWAQLSLSKIRSNGEITYTAFLKDVTEAVRQRREFEILSLVANETDNSVIITNPAGEIEYVNQGFTKLTGWTLAEVEGRKPGHFLQGEETDPAARERIREMIARREPFYQEILNYAKSGDRYWVSLSINPVHNERGELERFISIQANVTDTKQQALSFSRKIAAIGEAMVILEWNADWQLVETNPLFRELAGDQVESAAAQLSDTLDDAALEGLANDEIVQRVASLDNGNGERTDLEGYWATLRGISGRVERYVLFGLNVTERRRAFVQTREAMQDVLEGSKQIGHIVGTIDGISTQTNLLSLNAAIEAARAGEAGRAFSVVAQEVRELALRSHAAADDIRQLVASAGRQIDDLARSLERIER
ncbi:MAG: PAS domain S-box protein [Pseudomonadota bacterium]